MPRFDETGPLGYGPGTGWGMGPCACPPSPNGSAVGRRGAGIGWRRGFGRGFGRGRFWGYYPASYPTKKEETEILNEEAVALEEELKTIKQRLAELGAKK